MLLGQCHANENGLEPNTSPFTASSARTRQFTLSRGKRVVSGALLALPLIFTAQPVGATQIDPASPTASAITRAPAAPSRPLPLSAGPYQGQDNPSVRFLAHGAGYILFLTESGAVLRPSAPQQRNGTASSGAATTAIRLALVAASPRPLLLGIGRLPGMVSYSIGNNPHSWHAGIPTYAQVVYGRGGRMEYDFVGAPGAHPAVIRLRIGGTTIAVDGAMQRRYGGGASDAFVVQLNSAGSELRFATDLPISPTALEGTYTGTVGINIQSPLEPFLEENNASGSTFVYATFLDDVTDRGGIAANCRRDIYLAFDHTVNIDTTAPPSGHFVVDKLTFGGSLPNSPALCATAMFQYHAASFTLHVDEIVCAQVGASTAREVLSGKIVTAGGVLFQRLDVVTITLTNVDGMPRAEVVLTRTTEITVPDSLQGSSYVTFAGH